MDGPGSNDDRRGENPAEAARSLLGVALGGVLAVGVPLGCFTGSGAAGLPCEKDLDCGLELRCDLQTGCCGGSCSNASTSSTTTDTTTTDTPPTTTDGTSSSTTEMSTSSTGPEPFCGDGNQDDGEACDLGEDSNADPLSGCNEACELALFAWEIVDEDEGWSDNPDDYVDATLYPVPDNNGWRIVTTGEHVGAWGSGVVGPRDVEPMFAFFGEKVLLSDPFSLEPQSGWALQLAVEHVLEFDVCPDPTPHRDGGRVFLYFGEDPNKDDRILVAPLQSSSDDVAQLHDDSACVGEGAVLDWAEDAFPAFVGNSPSASHRFLLTHEDLSTYSGPVRLGFSAGYDCANCMLTSPSIRHEWKIRQVTLKLVPAPDDGDGETTGGTSD
jgi:hypothetical protein